MKKIQLVVCDVDSTLVTSHKELTPRAKKIIMDMHEQGIYFGIASGRPLDEIEKYAKEWEMPYQFDVLIGMNGSELWDGIHHQTYDYFKLKVEWMKEIMELMERFECNPMMYTEGKILCVKNDDMMKKSAKSSNKEIMVAHDLSQFYEKENAKLMFRMEKQLMSEVESFIEQHPSPYYAGFKTQDTLMEFADKRISKAYA
ncbi:MAG: HAD family phosphatase, partial [Erysipelotrichia bacterium]|nr:HAD family phosphatase [Erysipelotrichia bacterium]